MTDIPTEAEDSVPTHDEAPDAEVVPDSMSGRDIGLTRDQVDADEGGWPRWGVLGIACVMALAVGVFLAVFRDTGGTDSLVGDPSPDLVDGTVPPGHPSLDDSDQFEELTLAQLETEVADESAPVALRLTLAERYLATGDVADARTQARLALDQAGTDLEQQRALRDLGWAVALLGRAERGAELLSQALEVTPGERNATWYLANVRLAGLGDAEGAAELFRELLADDELGADQRALVEDRLADAEAVASGTTPAPTSIPPG